MLQNASYRKFDAKIALVRPILAHRNPQEKALIEMASSQSILGLSQQLDAEGFYRGQLGIGRDAINVELQIRSHPRDGNIVWFATMKVGEFTTIPLISAPSSRGLIRFMRSSGPIPGEISGLTGAVVPCQRGQCVEFRGIFFVPRNGRLTSLRLRKTAQP